MFRTSVAQSVVCCFLASDSSDWTIKIWNYSTTCKCLQTLTGHKYSVNALEEGPNNKLISRSHDNEIRVWNFETDINLHTLNEHKGSIHFLKLINRNTFASGSADKTNILLYKIKFTNFQQKNRFFSFGFF